MRDVLVAEFDSPEGVVEGARRVRALGYARVEAYTPFPIPELDDALAIPRTRLPYFVLAAGIFGAAIALLIQWWTNAFDYPINVGGRPKFSIPTDVPIVFETTVLAAAFASFGAVLVRARLPRLYDPLFDLPGFERTTVDRFWIVVRDPLHTGRGVTGPHPPSELPADTGASSDAFKTLCAELQTVGAVVTRGQLEEEP
ncbi:MAG TPA: DUF3341 domain-containing protein [Labilithrix sp.]|nr:DUF3341 domain-containing protein [Labilithrix sp.]